MRKLTKKAADLTSLSQLIPDPRNARKHTPRNVGAITDALREVGAARSIVIDEDDVILAGNATVAAATEAGLGLRVVESNGDEIIAVRRRGLTAKQKTRLALFDNRAAELAEWDIDVLRGLEPEDLAGMFTDDEWKGLTKIDRVFDKDPDDFDAEAEAAKIAKPVTKPGDLWLLGRHRLLCGDATNQQDVEKLMGGELADMVFTDPPYGVDYRGGTKKHRGLVNDHGATTIYGDVLPLLACHSTNKAAAYIWHTGAVSGPVVRALAENGYEVRAQIVWAKNMAQFGALGAQYKQKHEPCFYAFKKGSAPHWFGPNNEVTVWDVDRSRKNEFHPTQKPIGLAERAMANSSAPGALVLDLFGGSGSTLVAAEKSGRRANVSEIDPIYCDVIVHRWQEFTGERASIAGAAPQPGRKVPGKGRGRRDDRPPGLDSLHG